MPTHANNPLIAVHPDTKKRLDELGAKGRSYNDIIVVLLNNQNPVQILTLVEPKGFDKEKRICHGVPMQKVELATGKPGYKCQECLTLLVEDTPKTEPLEVKHE